MLLCLSFTLCRGERAHWFAPSVRNSLLDDGGRELHEYFLISKVSVHVHLLILDSK